MAGGGVKINNISVIGGANGKTPIFAMGENIDQTAGHLYNSYDGGNTWYDLGQVKGEDAVYAVKSVNGKTGVVALTADDISVTSTRKYVTAEQLEYLENQLYATPSVASFTLSPSTTTYEIGTTIRIDGFYHAETNIENISTLNICRGISTETAVTPKSTSTYVVYIDNYRPTTTSSIIYYLRGTNTKGVTFSRNVSITVYKPSYTGALTNASISASDLENLTKVASTSLSGTRTVTIPNTSGYVYFVSSTSITDIKDKTTGFGVSYTQLSDITKAINNVSVTFHVYRTDELLAGTYQYTIS